MTSFTQVMPLALKLCLAKVTGRACFRKNSSLHIWPKKSPFHLSKFMTTFFFSHHLLLRSCTLCRKIISLPTIFLRFYPKNFTLYLPKNLMTFFLSHHPFFPFLRPFSSLQVVTPIS